MTELQRAQDALEERAVKTALRRKEDPNADLTADVEDLLAHADLVLEARIKEATDRCVPRSPLLLSA